MKKAFIVIALFMSSNAFAGFACTGNISGVTLTPGGAVLVSTLMNWRYQNICNLTSPTNNTTTEACQAIYAMLLTAQTTGKKISMWFNAGDCSKESQADWSTLENWYYGPMLNE